VSEGFGVGANGQLTLVARTADQAAADAILAADEDVIAGGPDTPFFRIRRHLGEPAGVTKPEPVFALAGIAQPERFASDLRSAGWDLKGLKTFRDHHPYSARDLAAVAAAARAAGATAILTTEKDFVRLLPLRPFPMPVAWVPLTMEPGAPDEFRKWLAGSLAAARDVILD
jgi:tetraacyldisaccharide-1-P 4'-kinase